MKQLLWPMALISGTAAAAEGALPNYYDAAPPPSSYTSRPMVAPSQVSRKRFITDSESTSPSPAANSASPQPHLAASSGGSSAQPGLPPNMEKGVKDLELGMEYLQKYTAVMANHIQQNGLRGFLAVPPEIRDQGVAVGRKIGNGISGIATDTAHDMIVPERR